MSEQDNKSSNKWLTLTGLSFQMGITMYLFYELGEFIDRYFQFEKSLFALFFLILGMVLNILLIIKELNRLNE